VSAEAQFFGAGLSAGWFPIIFIPEVNEGKSGAGGSKL